MCLWSFFFTLLSQFHFFSGVFTGNDVKVAAEIIVYNAIIMPFKELPESTKNMIVL